MTCYKEYQDWYKPQYEPKASSWMVLVVLASIAGMICASLVVGCIKDNQPKAVAYTAPELTQPTTKFLPSEKQQGNNRALH